MHDPLLAGWCMVFTTKSMVETTQKQPSNHFKNTVVTRLLLSWNDQPIFSLDQPCFSWLKFLYGNNNYCNDSDIATDSSKKSQTFCLFIHQFLICNNNNNKNYYCCYSKCECNENNHY